MFNSDEILRQIETKDEKLRISIYVSKKIYDEFKRECKSYSASRTVEALMKIFIDKKKAG